MTTGRNDDERRRQREAQHRRFLEEFARLPDEQRALALRRLRFVVTFILAYRLEAAQRPQPGANNAARFNLN